MPKRARTLHHKNIQDALDLLTKEGGEELIKAAFADPNNRLPIVTFNQYELNLSRFRHLEKRFSKEQGMEATQVLSIEVVNQMINTIPDKDEKQGHRQ